MEEDEEKEAEASKPGRKIPRGRKLYNSGDDELNVDGDEGDTREARRAADSTATVDTRD